MNYILYGSQYIAIRRHLTKVLKECVKEPDDFNTIKIDYSESSIDEIISEASMMPLGYDTKAVVVDNATFLTKEGKDEEKQKLLECIKGNPDEINCIFILRSDKLDKNGEIAKYIDSVHGVFEFLDLTKEQWPEYVRKYFKKREVEIEPNAVHELVARVDGDLTRFVNEADKLCLYKDKITLSDVLLMVAKPLEDDAFQMSNALFKGDNALAISIYRDLKMLGAKATDALIPMLATQFRFIAQVCYLDNRGLDKPQIAKELGVSEGRVYMAMKNSRYLSRRQIAHALDDLYNLDAQIKSGQIDRSYGLELFLINFPN